MALGAPAWRYASAGLLYKNKLAGLGAVGVDPDVAAQA